MLKLLPLFAAAATAAVTDGGPALQAGSDHVMMRTQPHHDHDPHDYDFQGPKTSGNDHNLHGTQMDVWNKASVNIIGYTPDDDHKKPHDDDHDDKPHDDDDHKPHDDEVCDFNVEKVPCDPWKHGHAGTRVTPNIGDCNQTEEHDKHKKHWHEKTCYCEFGNPKPKKHGKSFGPHEFFCNKCVPVCPHLLEADDDGDFDIHDALERCFHDAEKDIPKYKCHDDGDCCGNLQGARSAKCVSVKEIDPNFHNVHLKVCKPICTGAEKPLGKFHGSLGSFVDKGHPEGENHCLASKNHLPDGFETDNAYCNALKGGEGCFRHAEHGDIGEGPAECVCDTAKVQHKEVSFLQDEPHKLIGTCNCCRPHGYCKRWDPQDQDAAKACKALEHETAFCCGNNLLTKVPWSRFNDGNCLTDPDAQNSCRDEFADDLDPMVNGGACSPEQLTQHCLHLYLACTSVGGKH